MRLDETVDPPVFDPDTVAEIANSTIWGGRFCLSPTRRGSSNSVNRMGNGMSGPMAT